MKPDEMSLKVALRKREAELRQLMNQMKNDNLDSSKVYKNLQQELETVKTKITSDQKS